MALNKNRIVFVGNNYQKWKTLHTLIIDLHGAMIVPGFIDNHTHFLGGGYNLGGVRLRSVSSKKKFIKALKDFCALHRDNRWILGGDWDHESWGGEMPHKKWIDSVSTNHPVFVSRYDGHMSFANSLALKLAGINGSTQAPAGGEIVKDSMGEPTGILKDEAQNLIFKIVPDPTESELDEYLAKAAQHALENGVTQVHDMSSYGGFNEIATYRRAYKAHKLPIRIYAFVPISSWRRLDLFCKENGKGDDRLRWGGVKGFVDGSLGATTAWFYKPYLDAPQTSGLQVTDTNLLSRWVVSADSAGLQVAVHAIGDRANDFILGVFREAEKKLPGIDRRFRIEHAQHLSRQAIGLFAPLKVIASVQPYHVIDDGKWAYKRIDRDVLSRSYAFNSLLKAKAMVSFGSDWTVAPLKPILGMYAACTRRTLDGKNPAGWYAEEKVSVQDALRCYTINNAYAGFQDNKLGQLKPGMLADFVVLNKNLFSISPNKIKDVKVLRTIINGKEVYVAN
ncbi:MAG: amidohydrolase [Flavisolibacter sp.]